MTTNTPATNTDESTPLTSNRSWRVVDIVVAAVLGVATGLIFFGWNTVGYAWFQAMDAITPGLGGIAAGIWFLGGPLGMLVIRKPGAAIFVELVGAVTSALIGNVWGISTLYSGLAQGIGAEIVFLAFAYRNYRLPVALLSGALAGVGAWTLELFTSPNLPKGFTFNAIYLVCTAVSGVVLAGLVGWLVVRALARTGVLSRFASGRDEQARAETAA
ncbi:ECF transporter S component [Brooklawnia cerclae]|uniref:Energy-coupling factor transport system substrate-specific component n=1 Tax=Brooklawnia cerclae TaxID=349934 RepID=A0ABX0SE38_9ACTN|nr:ECF transporter S component [Brooklawnia cerclae]NIH55583.1 energy-coupling factor transport system substrate-specific component [Brooklawnia cerclae]